MADRSILAQTPAFPSIDDALPSDQGGPVARTGLGYQDEIAVGFLVDMLSDPYILRVHCETHDDIVVVRNSEHRQIAEFVQVKAGAPDKLWSVADLCQRDAGKAGTSIFEISLNRDAYIEISRFRLVTLRPVVSDLKLLTFPFGSPGREPCGRGFLHVASALHERFPAIRSPKGNCAPFWVKHCYWDERHSESAVKKDNLLRVMQVGIAEGRILLPELADVLLDELRLWVARAGAAKWHPDRNAKIITRDALREWWERRTREILEGVTSPSGGKLAGKMRDAILPDELIGLALDIRRDYAAEARTPRFMDLEESAKLQARVKAELASLRAKYVAGQIALDAAGFHSLCLERMDAVNAERQKDTEDRSAFLKGCMYDITDRCLHRFTRPQS